MAKPRRPLETRCLPVTYSIDSALRERLDRRAKELGRSSSNVVRLALAEYLGRPADTKARRRLDLDLDTKPRGAR